MKPEIEFLKSLKKLTMEEVIVEVEGRIVLLEGAIQDVKDISPKLKEKLDKPVRIRVRIR